MKTFLNATFLFLIAWMLMTWFVGGLLMLAFNVSINEVLNVSIKWGLWVYGMVLIFSAINMIMPKDKKPEDISEGKVKKGGVNDRPTISAPTYPPKGQL